MATVTTLRTQLADITGRRNLATDKTLCDRVLNRACRYAEALQDTPQSVRRHFLKPAANALYTNVADLRSVRNIFVSDGTERGPLAYIDYADLKQQGLIGVENFGEAGTPEAYSTYPAMLSDEQLPQLEADFVTAGFDDHAYEDIQFAMAYDALAIMWLPASDGTWTFDIEGKWWPATLSDSKTTNWWTANQPDTLVYFAAMFLALERGNPEMAKHWRESALLGLDQVDKSLVEHELAPYTGMPGQLFIRG